MRVVVLVALVVLGVSSASYIGLPPPSIWPQPFSSRWAGSYTLAVPRSFQNVQYSGKSTIVKDAVARFLVSLGAMDKVYKINQYPSPIPIPLASTHLVTLNISVKDESEVLKLGVDESYSLTIDANSVIQAETVWGALYGLESLLQCVQFNGSSRIVQMAPVQIHDEPRYPWRGVLLDTARHFLPLSSIKTTIAGMAVNKLNVFHWHIVDAEAFPIQIRSHPELWKEGAYSPKAVYSLVDIADVVAFARARGVRVVVEVDSPGHTFSWGLGQSDIVLNCTQVMTHLHVPYPNINDACFDMTNSRTYEVFGDVLTELSSVFPDDFLHLGGDEVIFSCMDEFPRVKQWMQQNLKSASYYDLVQFYSQKIMALANGKLGKSLLFWQEAFFNAYVKPTHPKPLPKDTIIEVWMNKGRQAVMEQILQANTRLIIASPWYLANQVPNINGTTHGLYEDTWMDFYSDDPENGLDLPLAQMQLISGGEVCQWGEQVNEFVLATRMWPRTAAAAERLWSPKAVNDVTTAYTRLMAHTCRLAQRGIGSSPLRPDYCEF